MNLMMKHQLHIVIEGEEIQGELTAPEIKSYITKYVFRMFVFKEVGSTRLCVYWSKGAHTWHLY